MVCRVGMDDLGIRKNLLHFQGKENISSLFKSVPSHNNNHVFPVPIRNSHHSL